MKRLILVLFFLTTFACGPRPFTNLHMVSLSETNQGRALPVDIIPVDRTLAISISRISPEEWFVSDTRDTTVGIKKRVVQGSYKEVVKIERRNEKNDFLVVVDYADNKKIDDQNLLIGEKFYRAKDVYLLVGKDSVRLVEKKVYEDYLRAR